MTTDTQTRARAADPATSHAAAAAADLSGSQAAVLAALRAMQVPATDADIDAYHSMTALLGNVKRFSSSRLRTARKELQVAGLVREHDQDGRSDFSRAMTRWVLV